MAIVALAIVTTGCITDAYDVDRVPAAQSALSLANEQCLASERAMRITTAAEFMECHLAAVKQFVTTIRLRELELFDSYAQRERLLAARIDASEGTMREFQDAFKQMEADFYSSIELAQAIRVDRRLRTQQALQGVGMSLQQAGASLQGQSYTQQTCTGTATATGPRTATVTQVCQ